MGWQSAFIGDSSPQSSFGGKSHLNGCMVIIWGLKEQHEEKGTKIGSGHTAMEQLGEILQLDLTKRKANFLCGTLRFD